MRVGLQPYLDKAALCLIFLFPLLGNVMHRWHSTIFILLGLLSLFYLRRGWSALDRYQQYVAYSLIAFFAVFIVNASLLGWQSLDLNALGTEIRFVFILPLMCMAATLPRSKEALYIGLICSLVILLGQAFYELAILKHWRLSGAYNPLRTASITLATICLITPRLWLSKRYKSSLLTLFCGIAIIVATHGRMAMLAMIVIVILFIFILLQNWKQRLLGFFSLLLITLIVASLPVVQERFKEAKPLIEYATGKKQYAPNANVPSWVIHYMILETSWQIFKEHPWLGIGAKRYTESMKDYVKRGQAHPVMQEVRHGHTLFIEIATSKGIIGICTYSLFIFTLLLLARHRRQLEGIPIGMFTICTLLTGVTEPLWIYAGAGVAVLVVYLAVLSARPKEDKYTFSSNKAELAT